MEPSLAFFQFFSSSPLQNVCNFSAFCFGSCRFLRHLISSVLAEIDWNYTYFTFQGFYFVCDQLIGKLIRKLNILGHTAYSSLLSNPNWPCLQILLANQKGNFFRYWLWVSTHLDAKLAWCLHLILYDSICQFSVKIGLSR